MVESVFQEGKGGVVVEEKEKEGVRCVCWGAGRQVGCPGMFEHSRGKKALVEFKVKYFPPNTWSVGQMGTNGI